jgi:hypothetical protein
MKYIRLLKNLEEQKRDKLVLLGCIVCGQHLTLYVWSLKANQMARNVL